MARNRCAYEFIGGGKAFKHLISFGGNQFQCGVDGSTGHLETRSDRETAAMEYMYEQLRAVRTPDCRGRGRGSRVLAAVEIVKEGHEREFARTRARGQLTKGSW